jgi:hypothetical protein
MILILASYADNKARDFGTAHQEKGVRVLNCRHLACNAMALYHPEMASSFISVDGEQIPLGEIEGIINMLPFIIPEELFFFPDQERAYQCEELTALLNFLMASLHCPIINGPTALNRSGLSFNRLYWYNLASTLSIPAIKVDYDTSQDEFSIPEKGAMESSVYYTGLRDSRNASIIYQYSSKMAAALNLNYLKAYFVRDQDGQVRFAEARTAPDSSDERMILHFIKYFKKHSIQHDFTLGY